MTFRQLFNSGEISKLFLDPNVLMLCALLLMMALVNFSNLGNKKSLRTQAVLADRIVKYNLAKSAVKQLKNYSVKDICLYCGSFNNWQINPITLWVSIIIFNKLPSLFVPTANPGIEVFGAPGMGKTYSAIDRLLLSAIEQHFPIGLYDYKSAGEKGKGGQTEFIGPAALLHGYKLRIFAPGKAYSCVINAIEFLKDDKDISGAENLAKTFKANLSGQNSKIDAFFDGAGEKLLAAAFLWAKGTTHPDLATAFCFLNLPNLDKRLKYALEQNKLGLWNKISLAQFMSVLDAAETRDGIMGGAQLVASIFIRPDILPCILGKSNVSLNIGSKEILIFQSDEERKRVYNPLIAGIIELVVNHNFSYQRKLPFILSLDEYPTIKIEESIEWPNRHRSKGLVQIVGYQAKPQTNKYYGKNETDILRVGIKNRFFFNTQNLETEKEISELIGHKEVLIKSKSKSYSSKGGTQTSISYQAQLTPIFRPDDLRSMGLGSCIYINSLAKKRNRSFIPIYLPNMKILKKDDKFIKFCSNLWSTKIVDKLIQKEKTYRAKYNVEQELEIRNKLANELLPLPETQNKDNIIDTFNFLD